MPAEARGEGVESLETGTKESCKLPCGFWETNPASLEEQHIFLMSPSVFYFIVSAFVCWFDFGTRFHRTQADLM